MTEPSEIAARFAQLREDHLNGRCTTGKCAGLINYSITDDCIGCTLCAQGCPASAIEFLPHEKHEIQQDICIKCDACRQVCPSDAVKVQ